jgi:hypothetical protein
MGIGIQFLTGMTDAANESYDADRMLKYQGRVKDMEFADWTKRQELTLENNITEQNRLAQAQEEFERKRRDRDWESLSGYVSEANRDKARAAFLAGADVTTIMKYDTEFALDMNGNPISRDRWDTENRRTQQLEQAKIFMQNGMMNKSMYDMFVSELKSTKDPSNALSKFLDNYASDDKGGIIPKWRYEADSRVAVARQSAVPPGAKEIDPIERNQISGSLVRALGEGSLFGIENEGNKFVYNALTGSLDVNINDAGTANIAHSYFDNMQNIAEVTYGAIKAQYIGQGLPVPEQAIGIARKILNAFPVDTYIDTLPINPQTRMIDPANGLLFQSGKSRQIFSEYEKEFRAATDKILMNGHPQKTDFESLIYLLTFPTIQTQDLASKANINLTGLDTQGKPRTFNSMFNLNIENNINNFRQQYVKQESQALNGKTYTNADRYSALRDYLKIYHKDKFNG